MNLSLRLFLFLCLAAPAFAAAPVIDAAVPGNRVPPSIPVGKTLLFPITALDPDADPLTFKVTSNNSRIIARVKTGNPVMRLRVTIGGGAPADMTFQLFREWTPISAGFIGGFAQSGFFNNVKFHRVVKNFVIQGGDPLGTGLGGPGMTDDVPATAFKFDNEFQPGLIFSGRGQLAMANSGYAGLYTGTNGSQFFITHEQLHVPTAAHGVNLDFKHTILGQMLRGWEVLDAIANVPVDGNSKPNSDVVITAAGVEPNNHDAVLMLSATALVSNVTITVTADDGKPGGVTTQTFLVSSIVDGANSPPVIQNISPLVAPKETQLDFGLRTFDLESDYLRFNHGLLIGTGSALSSSQGPIAAVLGNAGFEGPIRLGLNAQAYSLALGDFETPTVQNYADIGIGDRAVRATAVVVKDSPGSSFSGVIARFQDLDPAGTTGNYAETYVNWGDGTPEHTATVARDTSDGGAGKFVVTGAHTYAHEGTYTIIVNVEGNKGALAVARSTAVITAEAISAVGEQIEVKGAVLKNRILATFTDSNAPGRPADYSAAVDWGDGTSAKGVISKAGDGSFVVRGTHTYKDAEPFAISVRIRKGTSGGSDAYAWSTANVFGFTPAQHLPPFPVAHLVGAWNSGPAKSATNAFTGATPNFSTISTKLAGAFVVINSGRKTSPISKIRYWLSTNTTVEAGDTPLLANGLPEIIVSPFTSGSGGQGQFTIALPKGQSGGGKYLLGQLVYSDPIIDASPKVEKVVVSGPIDPSVVVYDRPTGAALSAAGEILTNESGTSATFRVVLDTAPTANVTIPLESTVVAEGTVSPASLIFTPGNWNLGQLVTVTGVNDGANDGDKPYKIRLKEPTSTDSNYTDLGGAANSPVAEISFRNIDND